MDHRDFTWPRLPLVLQRILELQKEAAVADNMFAFLQAIGNLRAAAMAVAKLNHAARELVLFCGRLHVDEGLILGVTQYGGVRNRQRIGDGAGIDGGGDVHILLQFFPGIFRDDARLERARVGIERRGDVRNFSVKSRDTSLR